MEKITLERETILYVIDHKEWQRVTEGSAMCGGNAHL